MFKNVILVAALAIGSLSFGQEDRLAEIDAQWGFSSMSSKEIKSKVLSTEGTSNGAFKAYVEYRKIINSRPRVPVKSEWDGWKVESRTTSNALGKFSSFTTYSKKFGNKTVYYAVHMIDGKERSRTKTVMDW